MMGIWIYNGSTVERCNGIFRVSQFFLLRFRGVPLKKQFCLRWNVELPRGLPKLTPLVDFLVFWSSILSWAYFSRAFELNSKIIHTHHHDLTDMYQEKWSRSINSERFFDMSDGSRRVTVKHAWIAQNTNFTTPYQTFSSLENLYNTVLKPTEQFMVKNKNPDIPTSINNKKTAFSFWFFYSIFQILILFFIYFSDLF